MHNDKPKKLPLWEERETVNEQDTMPISGLEVKSKVQHYHDKLLKWKKIVQEFLHENK